MTGQPPTEPRNRAAIVLGLLLLAGIGAAAVLAVAARGDGDASTAAGSATTTAATAAPATPAPTTSTPPTSEPATTVVDTGEIAPIEDCHVPTGAFNGVGFVVPRFDGLARSVGTIRIATIFADFDDAPATRTPEEVFAILDGPAAEFYREVSYGRAEFVLEPHFEWYRLSEPSAHYGAALLDGELHRRFIQEAVTLADPAVDFSGADYVLVVSNPDAPNVPFGPVFVSTDPGWNVEADGRVFTTSITSGFDLNHWGGMWLAHEIGHTVTLPDLYEYGSTDSLRFVGDFSLMGDIAASSPGLFVVERWQLGWLDDPQITCQTGGSASHVLTPIETIGGMKAVVVPVGPTRFVVVESRRPIGVDAGMPDEGALVYVVDSSIASGTGTLDVMPGVDAGPAKIEAPMAPGESYTVAGVTITVTSAGPEGDTVQVDVAG